MKAVGIIAEYDPFHRGHAWQIAQAKQQGAEAVAVCMSGDLVQRGAAALLPPWVRAKAALCCGADLVIELPNPWACLSAEGFAEAGVHLLSALPGLEGLVFGAENADAELLQKTAELLLTEEFSERLARQLGLGLPFAAARANAAGEILRESAELLKRPNNNLGVEYCKAILRKQSGLRPLPLERRGADHGQQQKDREGFSSASHLRECWQQGGAEALEGQVPAAALEIYQTEKEQVIDRRAWEIALLSRLRAMTPQQIARTRGTGEGLEYLLANSVRTAGTLDEVYTQMKSKRYAHARLRRYVLDAALGYTAELPKDPPYLHVLAANEKGIALLKNANLPADTSLAKLAKKGPEQEQAVRAHLAGADLAALCRQKPQPMGQSFTRAPFLQK